MDGNVEVLALSELQTRLREGIEEVFPARVWVRAEVAAVQVKASGHCYLDLCESDGESVTAKVKAVIWRGRYFPLSAYFREATGGDIVPGISILVRVQVNYSELYGLTLVIDELEPEFTLGEAELRRRRTVGKLEAEGLMDAQKSLEPSRLPYALAVISAEDAAGFGDFRRHLLENQYGFRFRVDLFPAAMQGQAAPQSIADALDAVQGGRSVYDAVLILRGGGSALDLACFDEYVLASAIAKCRIPVYTAIGHDRDQHVADMVAFASVKTPTALADEFIDAFAAEDERISSYAARLKYAFAAKVSALQSRLDVLAERIRNADPRSVLARGYTLVTDDEGVVLKSAAGLNPGQRIKVLFADGEVEAQIFNILPQ